MGEVSAGESDGGATELSEGASDLVEDDGDGDEQGDSEAKECGGEGLGQVLGQ